MCCDESMNVSISYCNCKDKEVQDIEEREKCKQIIDCGLNNFFFLIGPPSNLLTMIVFYRQGLRDRMNLCLFCLAFSDLMYLTAMFLLVSYCLIGIAVPDQKEFWALILSKYCLSLLYGFMLTSGCVTMIIAVERCVCVMFPMKAATLISTKTMAIILLVTFIVIHLLCSVYYIKENFTLLKNNATGETTVMMTTSDFYLNHTIFGIIENIVLSLISFVTFTVVCISTAIIVVTLRRASAWRKGTASTYLRGQAVLTRMLVVIACTYLLCTVPNVLLWLAKFTVPEFRVDGRYSFLFLQTHRVAGLPVTLNSSVGFFFYTTMSSRFRQELKCLCSTT